MNNSCKSRKQGTEEKAFYSRREKQHVFHPPQYGFHGRDLDILKIEKQVLRHNHLLLQGMGGAGKTTLLELLILLAAFILK